jgi:polyisoprenoid-binding protein YceI
MILFRNIKQMKKAITIVLLLVGVINTVNAQLYKVKPEGSTITFFSKAPLEDITATNKKATFVINTNTNDIQVGITMVYFKFPKPLMEEHFNENYVESPKYPTAIFMGKINEAIDYTKDGEHKVTVKGTLNLHGVTKDVELQGTLTKKGNEILINTEFKIKIADYNIKVPSLYVQNIAETVDVKAQATLEPFTKK